jgi:purine-binding chemotaxis protein CheW
MDWNRLQASIRKAIEQTQAGGEIAPEQAMRLMQERARQLAAPQSAVEEAPNETYLELLTFSAASASYAIETAYVHAVLRTVLCTPVPGLPAHFRGLANVRGEIVAVVDLPPLLRPGAAPAEQMQWGLLMGIDHYDLLLNVDAIFEVTRLAQSDIGQASGLTPEAQTYAHGVTRTGTVILDGRAILTDARLVVGAQSGADT